MTQLLNMTHQFVKYYCIVTTKLINPYLYLMNPFFPGEKLPS